jgi:hypothetical protein
MLTEQLDCNNVTSVVAEGGKPANGDGPLKKLSAAESFHEKLKSQQPESVEQ